MTSEEEIKWLANQILYHKRLYYTGTAIIPDQAYDRLEDKLKILDADHPILKVVGYEEPDFLAGAACNLDDKEDCEACQ